MMHRNGWRYTLGLGVVAGIAIMAGFTPARGIAPLPAVDCLSSPAVTVMNPADITIADNATATSTVSVTGLSGVILDIDVATRIRHTAPGDLDLILTGPSGRSVTLSTGNGGVAADVFNGTVWDDDADPDGIAPYSSNDGLVTDHNYIIGVAATPLAPQIALAAFRDGNPNGTWTLAVRDTLIDDVGVLDEWALTVTTGTRDRANMQSVTATAAPGLTLPDGGTIASSVVVQGDQASLSDLRVTTNVAHSSSMDVQVTLTSPAGTTVTLTSNNGGGAVDSFAGTSWGQGPGTTPLTKVIFNSGGVPQGVLVPEEPFAAFAGEDPRGVWTLTLSDTVLNLVGGTLRSWSVDVSTQRPCTPTLALTQTSSHAVVPVGKTVTLQITGSNGGSGVARDVFISGSTPARARRLSVTPSSGGACDSGLSFTCTWAGTTNPGGVRNVVLVVEPFVAGNTFHIARMGMASPSPSFMPWKRLDLAVSPSDVRAANGRRCTVLGTPGADELRPLAVAPIEQVICGLGGPDVLLGGGSAETLDGGSGNDVIWGAKGNDFLFGGPGSDRLHGGRGIDLLKGGAGGDLLNGGLGRDTLVGGRGDDRALQPARDLLTGIERHG